MIPVLLLSGLLSERTLKKNLFCFTRCFEPLEMRQIFAFVPIFLRTPPQLKRFFKRLEAYVLSSLYSNTYNTTKPVDQRNKVDVAMQNRDSGESFRGFTPTCGKGSNTRSPFFSRVLVRRGTMANTSQERKSSSL